MVLMARREKPKKEPETEREKGRARETGVTISFNFEMSPRLNATLKACSKKERRTLKAVITLALEQYFERAGMWDASQEEEGS
jgi:hypothetical protein